ncbi:MAG: putative thioredoxin [Bacteroidetes bacterium HLUCCA01]|nr:MAG: putative thioredoxin [Bacteroidetes bacterium HLUCCA01]
MKHICIVIIAFTALSCGSSQGQPDEPLELIHLSSDQVEPVIQQHFPDKAVLVNVWATWCIPCIEEFPYLVQIREEFKDDLEVVFISADFPEALDRVNEFLSVNNVHWQTYLKDDRDEPFINAIWTEWTGALPATIVYNKSGNKIAAFERPAHYDEFRELAQQAINQN